ncbi:MAG TPA: MBL fold metallo-hydrolase [Candidatus Thermoplasmatota archaeon]|nr:MBL fold metallo-hydrolase [Candidatus Thermoplasmatota archaeon]
MAAERRERSGDVERLHMSRSLAGRAIQWTSVYRVGDALVDSGCSSARPVFARFLRERAPLVSLVTHEHEDHIGNHALLPADTRVAAPALAARFLRDGHPPFPFYRRFVWGYHEPARGADLVGDKVDVAGRAFRVLQTNGHSMDHVAYLDERENGLFSGDAYMGKLKSVLNEEDVHTELASLRAMAALDPATLYPAHGPVIERPRARLLDTVAYFEDLWRRAWAMKERRVPERKIARELLGGPQWITRISMGEFSEENLVRNLLRRPLP